MNNQISIYLVDDHKIFTQSFELFIHAQEDFVWKGSGLGDTRTLNNIMQINPNIVLLDYHLPNTNGLNILKCLRDCGFKNKIVMLTMNRDFQVKEATKSYGANGFVTKETDGNELLFGLKELSNGEIDFLEIPAKLLNENNNPYILTEQEKIVAKFVCCGMDSEDISRKLNISVHTVNTHRRRILAKTQSDNFLQVCLKIKEM